MPQLDIRYFFPSAFFAFLIFCFIYFLLRRLVLPYFFTLFFIRRKLISFITGSTLKAQEMSFKVQNSVTITTRNLLKLLVDAQILVFEELALLTYTRLLNVVSMLVPQERFLIEFFVWVVLVNHFDNISEEDTDMLSVLYEELDTEDDEVVDQIICSEIISDLEEQSELN